MVAESLWASMKSSANQAPNQTCVFHCILKGYTACRGIDERFFNQDDFFESLKWFAIKKFTVE